MMRDRFHPPALRRQAEIPVGMVFLFGGRPLIVRRVHGTDPAAPVIVEELTDAFALKGQLALWSLDCVQRVVRAAGLEPAHPCG